MRIAALICGAIALYILGRLLVDLFIDQFGLQLRVRNEPLLHRTIMTDTVIYALLMAIPFMPGIEIALGMLVIFGAKIVFLVYASTVAALTLAYAVGRLFTAAFAVKAFGLVGFTKAQDGMTPLFSFPAYLLTVALAVAPMPLFIFVRHQNGTCRVPDNWLVGRLSGSSGIRSSGSRPIFCYYTGYFTGTASGSPSDVNPKTRPLAGDASLASVALWVVFAGAWKDSPACTVTGAFPFTRMMTAPSST